MHYVQGNPQGIRDTASEFDKVAQACDRLANSIDASAPYAPAVGTGAGAASIKKLLEMRASECRDISQKARTASSVLDALAGQLEAINAGRTKYEDNLGDMPDASRPLVHPGLAPFDVGISEAQGATQAAAARGDAATRLKACFPNGTAFRLIDEPESRSTIENIGHGIEDMVTGVVDVAIGLFNLTFRALFDPHGAGQAWSDLGSTTSMIYNAAVNDTFPDGSHGARAALLDALRKLPSDIADTELLDRDPAAWFVLRGIDIAGLLVGATEVKAALTGIKESRAVTVTMEQITKAAGAVGISYDALRAASATARLFAKYPELRARLVFPLDASKLTPRIWSLSPLGKDGRGYQVETYIRQLLSQGNPNLIDLAWPHPKIDFADPVNRTITSVKSIDLGAPTYADDPQAAARVIKQYAEQLDQWGDPHVNIPSDQVDRWGTSQLRYNTSSDLTRDLYIGIPDTEISPDQAVAIQQALHDLAAEGNHVNVYFMEIKR